MRKNSVQWFLGLSAFAALCLIGLMLNPSVIYTRILSIVCVAGIIDAVVFFIGYGIFRKFEMLVFWKFAVYLVLIVAPSTIISGITTDLSHNFFVARDNFFVLRPDIRPDPQLFLLFCAFILFVSLNFVLWRVLFNVTIRQAGLLGFLVSFFNTIACLIATPIVKCF